MKPSLSRSRSDGMKLDSSLKRNRISTHNFLNLFPILEDEEGRHGADVVFLSYLWEFIDGNLSEEGGGVGFMVGESRRVWWSVSFRFMTQEEG